RTGGPPPTPERNRLAAEDIPATVKSVVVVTNPVPAQGTPASVPPAVQPASGKLPPPAPAATGPALPRSGPNPGELWQPQLRAARRKLEPEGALTGATRELQGGLGTFLQFCHEHGVKVGPWRLQHVVGELSFGDHPT